MSLKSIRPISPTPAMMPSKAVAPMSAQPAHQPIGNIGRPAQTAKDYFYKLPQLGVDKSIQKNDSISNRDGYLSTRLADTWKSIAKYLPTQTVVNRGKKFDPSQVVSFATWNDFNSGISADFGPGALRTYQTKDGPKNMYEYQYNNFLKYGDVNGSRFSSSFEFRDNRWWSVNRAREAMYGLDSSLPSFLLEDPLTTAEEQNLYHLSIKNNLSRPAYEQLRNYSVARKYAETASQNISQLADQLTSPSAVPGYSSTFQYGDVFGSAWSSADLSYVKPLSLTNTLLLGGANVALAFLGSGGFGKLGTPGGSSFSGPTGGQVNLANTIQNFLRSIFYRKSKAQAKRDAMNDAIINAGGGLWQRFTQWVGTTRSADKQYQQGLDIFVNNNYDNALQAVNQNGQVVNSYGQITDGPTRQTIDVVWVMSGVSKDELASYLGAYYKRPIADKFKKAYDEYTSAMSSSFFSNLSLPTFYGR